MTVDTWSADVLIDVQLDLGESPLWDHRTGSLVFIDIHAGELYVLDRPGQAHVTAFGGGIGAVVLMNDLTYLAATPHGFIEIEKSGGRRHVLDLPIPADLRMNDCQVGPDGSVWGGTMPWVVGESESAGTFFKLTPDVRAEPMIQDVAISNGIGWAPSGDLMYYVDSATRGIDVFDFDRSTSTLSGRRSFVQLARGVPDGLCVDADGAVWVAAYNAHEVQRYSPAGELIGSVAVPARQVTSCCFGGENLDLLYVTSASSGIRAPDRHREHAGAVFVAEVNATGQPANAFRTGHPRVGFETGDRPFQE